MIHKTNSKHVNTRYISQAQLHRLAAYYTKLDALSKENKTTIKSEELGKYMGISASLVRADLSAFGEFGRTGHGYNVEHLHSSIAEILGVNCYFSAILVGAGRLGQTLMGNFPFSQYGVRLKGAFDIDPEIIGTTISGYSVMDVKRQGDFIRENDVNVAILSVPKANAQHAAEILVHSGIQGIWNFTDTNLSINNSEVVVENVHFSNSLLALTCSMRLSKMPVLN